MNLNLLLCKFEPGYSLATCTFLLLSILPYQCALCCFIVGKFVQYKKSPNQFPFQIGWVSSDFQNCAIVKGSIIENHVSPGPWHVWIKITFTFNALRHRSDVLSGFMNGAMFLVQLVKVIDFSCVREKHVEKLGKVLTKTFPNEAIYRVVKKINTFLKRVTKWNNILAYTSLTMAITSRSKI